MAVPIPSHQRFDIKVRNRRKGEGVLKVQ
jgi:hypothetical protein